MLSKKYFSFIRPVLEYADRLWDNCSDREVKLLEDIQVTAARIYQVLEVTHPGQLYMMNWVLIYYQIEERFINSHYFIKWSMVLPPNIYCIYLCHVHCKITTH